MISELNEEVRGFMQAELEDKQAVNDSKTVIMVSTDDRSGIEATAEDTA